MGQIWGLVLTEPERSVMMALADHADDDGSNCYPGMEYLEWKVDKSERQLRRVITRLVDLGVVEIVERGLGRGNVSGFKIHVMNGQLKPNPHQRKAVIQSIKADIQGRKEDIEGNKSGHSGFEKGTSTVAKEVIQGQNSGAIRKNHVGTNIEPDKEPERDAHTKKKPPRVLIDDEEWMATMEANPLYEGIDIRRLQAKMVVWCQVNHKQPSRRRLVNWLNREEKPMTNGNGVKSNGNGYKTQPERQRESFEKLGFTFTNDGEDYHQEHPGLEPLRIAARSDDIEIDGRKLE